MRKLKTMTILILIISSIMVAVLTAIAVLFVKKILVFHAETFYWLFATIAQSTAALFAVVGMFAVFRYQMLGTKLSDLRTSVKRKFATHDWRYHFGITDSESWADIMVEYEARKAYQRPGLRLPPAIDGYLSTSLILMKHMSEEQDSVLKNAKVPLASFLVTFLIAIGCLPFASLLTDKFIGFMIVDVIIAFASFSMIVTFWYLAKSISTGKADNGENEVSKTKRE